MSQERAPEEGGEPTSRVWTWLVGSLIELRVVVALVMGLVVVAGLIAQPFEAHVPGLPRARVAVDAIPDTGEQQHIVFTAWPGRSPRDVEDQITYPLTSALLGLPGVKTVRSQSMLGISSIYVIFEDSSDYYWARSRIMERLAALPQGTLPPEVFARLGPDATALGQVFWYTLEGRDARGQTTSGWSLDELRSLQDWVVRPALQAVPGVAEVSSVGGHVKEYQIEIDARALKAHDVTLAQVADAVRQSNLDIGARTMEINRVEYVVRGLGQLKGLDDLEQLVVAQREDRAITLAQLGHVTLGPAERRGALDVAGADAVGGVVVARYGANPVEVIEQVKLQLQQLGPALPKRALPDGRTSQVTLVPFYDRSQLVEQVLGTLSDALVQQVLITIAVILILMGQLRSSLIVSLTLPLGVLTCFALMKLGGISADVMSLAGIAIAIGTMVDMGIVFVEAMAQRLEGCSPRERARAVRDAAAQVAPAVLTSTLTTVLSFLPVFGLTEAEGKLFGPLAYTKTFALIGAFGVALTLLPALVLWLVPSGGLAQAHAPRPGRGLGMSAGASRVISALRQPREWALVLLGVLLWAYAGVSFGIGPLLLGGVALGGQLLTPKLARGLERALNLLALVVVAWGLTTAWMPLGLGRSFGTNLALVVGVSGGLLLMFWLFLQVYEPLLRWALRHALMALSVPALMVALGLTAWLGGAQVWGFLPASVLERPGVARAIKAAPGLGREFMPPFDEGSFLYMPTTMPHASFGQAQEQLAQLDMALKRVPEVELVVGKLGRVESTLDPAPISMFETMITYKPQWGHDAQGRRVRLWRDHIKTPDDIWQELLAAAALPGLTSAPKLMPISTRQVMLQSGMRAAMGVKVSGPSLEAIERAVSLIEDELKQVQGLRPETVFGERVVGKPYLEIELDRQALGRYGLSVEQAQRALSVALGGVALTTILHGRERYVARARVAREDRDDPEALLQLLIASPSGQQLPLSQLATLRYVRGPQMIKSEATRLTNVVIFDKRPELSEVEAVLSAQRHLDARRASGQLALPEGVRYELAGNYLNQQRSEARLRLLVPLAMILIILVLYLQFRSLLTVSLIFTSVAVAMSGGFMLLWAYNQPGFMAFTILGEPARQVFQIGPMNLSVAVWVGFIALIGVATDDGVVMATYLKERFEHRPPTSWAQIQERVVEAGVRRVRPCLMTTATTLLALLPVITSQGRGSDVMIPMAVPVLGGMAVELVTLFVVPLLWALSARARLRLDQALAASPDP